MLTNACPVADKFEAKPTANRDQNTANMLSTENQMLESEVVARLSSIPMQTVNTSFDSYFRDIVDEKVEEKEVADIIATKVAEAVEVILVEVSLTAINLKRFDIFKSMLIQISEINGQPEPSITSITSPKPIGEAPTKVGSVGSVEPPKVGSVESVEPPKVGSVESPKVGSTKDETTDESTKSPKVGSVEPPKVGSVGSVESVESVESPKVGSTETPQSPKPIEEPIAIKSGGGFPDIAGLANAATSAANGVMPGLGSVIPGLGGIPGSGNTAGASANPEIESILNTIFNEVVNTVYSPAYSSVHTATELGDILKTNILESYSRENRTDIFESMYALIDDIIGPTLKYVIDQVAPEDLPFITHDLINNGDLPLAAWVRNKGIKAEGKTGTGETPVTKKEAEEAEEEAVAVSPVVKPTAVNEAEVGSPVVDKAEEGSVAKSEATEATPPVDQTLTEGTEGTEGTPPVDQTLAKAEEKEEEKAEEEAEEEEGTPSVVQGEETVTPAKKGGGNPKFSHLPEDVDPRHIKDIVFRLREEPSQQEKDAKSTDKGKDGSNDGSNDGSKDGSNDGSNDGSKDGANDEPAPEQKQDQTPNTSISANIDMSWAKTDYSVECSKRINLASPAAYNAPRIVTESTEHVTQKTKAHFEPFKPTIVSKMAATVSDYLRRILDSKTPHHTIQTAITRVYILIVKRIIGMFSKEINRIILFNILFYKNPANEESLVRTAKLYEFVYQNYDPADYNPSIMGYFFPLKFDEMLAALIAKPDFSIMSDPKFVLSKKDLQTRKPAKQTSYGNTSNSGNASGTGSYMKSATDAANNLIGTNKYIKQLGDSATAASSLVNGAFNTGMQGMIGGGSVQIGGKQIGGAGRYSAAAITKIMIMQPKFQLDHKSAEPGILVDNWIMSPVMMDILKEYCATSLIGMHPPMKPTPAKKSMFGSIMGAPNAQPTQTENSSITSGIANGLSNMGKSLTNGVSDVGKSLTNGVSDVGKSLTNGLSNVSKVGDAVKTGLSGVSNMANVRSMVSDGLKGIDTSKLPEGMLSDKMKSQVEGLKADPSKMAGVAASTAKNLWKNELAANNGSYINTARSLYNQGSNIAKTLQSDPNKAQEIAAGLAAKVDAALPAAAAPTDTTTKGGSAGSLRDEMTGHLINLTQLIGDVMKTKMEKYVQSVFFDYFLREYSPELMDQKTIRNTIAALLKNKLVVDAINKEYSGADITTKTFSISKSKIDAATKGNSPATNKEDTFSMNTLRSMQDIAGDAQGYFSKMQQDTLNMFSGGANTEDENKDKGAENKDQVVKDENKGAENKDQVVKDENKGAENKGVEDKDQVVKDENKGAEDEDKGVENENKVVENENKVVENENKVAEDEVIKNEVDKDKDENKVVENESKVVENESKVVENESKDDVVESDVIKSIRAQIVHWYMFLNFYFMKAAIEKPFIKHPREPAFSLTYDGDNPPSHPVVSNEYLEASLAEYEAVFGEILELNLLTTDVLKTGINKNIMTAVFKTPAFKSVVKNIKGGTRYERRGRTVKYRRSTRHRKKHRRTTSKWRPRYTSKKRPPENKRKIYTAKRI